MSNQFVAVKLTVHSDDAAEVAAKIARHLEGVPGVALRETGSMISYSHEHHAAVTLQGVTVEINSANQRVQVGKYAGRYFVDVLRDDPKYACWLASRNSEMLSELRRLIPWLTR